MSTFYTLLTTVGLAKLANAQALGTVVQWSQMAVGDGNGNPTTPSEAQTALVRERYRASLNQLTTDPENPNYLIAEMIIPATVGGWTVHEIGIFDADGDMVAVANCPASYKPVLAEGSTTDLVIRVIVQLSNTASVQLKIDPAVVLASRKWVIDNYVERTKLAGGTTNQVLRKKSNADLDVEWANPLSAVTVLVTSVEETQTLATAQTIVDLATVTTQGCAVYIEGVRLRPDQFARTNATRITLGQAYPSGSKITIVQNEEASGVAASESEPGLVQLATQAEVEAGTNTTKVITPATAASVASKQLQPIAASVASNALTLTLNPTTLEFRSSTLTDGTINRRKVSAAINLVISSGSTLGTANGRDARLVLLAIDNAGTVELAVANLAGGLNLDETTLVSTTAEGGAGAADSASVIYSQTARANVPFRVVGFIDITEATAGTWASAPTRVQGCGGQALAAMSSLGYGQTWQNLTASRAAGTTYYNLTGRTIFIAVILNTAGPGLRVVTVNGVAFTLSLPNIAGASLSFWMPIPPGASYGIDSSFSIWNELR